LKSLKIDPPTVSLLEADVGATRWSHQTDVDWVLLTPSLAMTHNESVLVAFTPPQYVDFVVLWSEQRNQNPLLVRLLDVCRTTDLPAGWVRRR
jgi:hypothetical protein